MANRYDRWRGERLDDGRFGVSDAVFHRYVMDELLGDIGGVTSRAMFGGYGIYREGVIFALIAEGRLYFKVGQSNQADYDAYGSEPFVYTGKGDKPISMSYWELPAEVMEDRGLLEEWVERSCQVSLAGKPGKKRRPSG